MTDVLSAAECYTAALARELLAVRARECPACYVVRQISEHGCDGRPRFAEHWARERGLATTGPQLQVRPGGGRCDCAVFVDQWTLRPDLLIWNPSLHAMDWPQTLPSCARVERGSSHPCSLWRPQYPGN